ncbi:Crp/Fnr family transcriptional regulator [Noviherbaspirillum denitrificans]|uniref:Crp/Fnr family transcriptional regulator n=1 Tax=Noviherbaspirillum denitrificans TaxID=1968433 RepID=A0A254TQ82_9BURK|nr:Crp/Fnr family transcriptional regulator [Noviherbaspirillum denitrificans]OWW21888.1 Crp/Fnr family transcriptional regulator [Noviherbaspirillum denitrificans]
MTTPSETLVDILRRAAWAQSLTPEQMARVESDITERFVPAGGYACRKGEPVNHWIGTIDGLLKMSSVSPEGKIITFTGVLGGAWFGEGSLLKDTPRQYDVIALRDTRLALMPRATFHWLLDSSIAFNRFVMTLLNERLGMFISLVEYDRMLDTTARLARCLAALFNPHLNPGISPQLKISQEELGYLCGASRQRVNGSLKALEEAGLVSAGYGGITILDLEGLRTFQS